MDYILGFVLLLGVLVFIHEFGHFIVAKAFGIRVETFSIGMGKKIVNFRRGETEYALSLLPLGGYVKLTGQDPREEVPPEFENRSFRGKPLYQRAAVVLAGPVFNAILAILVFTYLYSVGMPAPAAAIERLLPNSPAEQAGFRLGDQIRTITASPAGGTPETHAIADLSDFERIVGESVGVPLTFDVLRRGGETAQVNYTPVLGLDRDSTIGVIKERGVLKGVERNAVASTVTVHPGSWIAARGVASPFVAMEMEFTENGAAQTVNVLNIVDFENAWTRAVAAQKDSGKIVLKGQKIVFETSEETAARVKAKRPEPESEEKTYTLAWTSGTDRPGPTIADAGFRSTELVLSEIQKGSPAERLGLQSGDRLDTLNGQKIQSFTTFRERLQELAGAAQPIQLGWERADKLMNAEIKPELVEMADPLTEAKKKQFQIGATFRAVPAPPAVVTVKAENFGEALTLGYSRSYQLTSSMLQSFYHLAKGDISFKTMGGPIMIAKISGESLKQGKTAFLRMMAFISLNLFLLNLFPIPVLDGGHLVMFAMEAIRRRPLSIKFIEVWSTAGFVLLMSLVAVVMFNDISRMWFKS